MPRGRLWRPWATLAACLLGSLTGAAGTCAPGPGMDGVARVQAVLEGGQESPAAREAELRRAVDGLLGLAEMKRALLLAGWSGPGRVGEVERRCRGRLAGIYETRLRQALREGPTGDRLEALRVLMLGSGDAPELLALRAERYFEDVALLTRAGTPPVRDAAVQALPRLGADPAAVAELMRPLLCDPDAALRRTAATSIRDALAQAQAGAGVRPGDAARTTAALVPLAGAGLSDADLAVRRAGAVALVRAGEVLRDVVGPGERLPAGVEVAEAERGLEASLELAGPLARALADQAAGLAAALADTDADVGQAARQTLEAMAGTRRAVQARLRAINAAPAMDGSAARRARLALLAREDPLRGGLERVLPTLTAALRSPQAATRTQAVEMLEALGDLASPAVPDLLATLEDRDRFVRWAAARALGQAGGSAAATDKAVAGLTRALDDGDGNVRRAALTSLAGYGPAARPALPQVLAAARSTDPESRLAALRAVQALGRSEQAALAVITAALGDQEPRVRSLAEGLLKQGPVNEPRSAQVLPERGGLPPVPPR